MPNKMLVDATHPEETRVVVLRGNRVEEFDYESANRKQLRGNIYLAKVTRVEPSLQAAFIEYGGNRHGFLAFSEIHPDYYQIPTADRQALLEDEARAHADEEAEHERRSSRRNRGRRNRGANRRDEKVQSEVVATGEGVAQELISGETHDGAQHDHAAHEHVTQENGTHETATHDAATHEAGSPETFGADHSASQDAAHDTAQDTAHEMPSFVSQATPLPASSEAGNEQTAHETAHEHDHAHDEHAHHHEHAHDDHAHEHHAHEEHHEHAHDEHHDEHVADDHAADDGAHDEDEHVEDVGGADALEEAAPPRPRHRRQYKIQEVIKRRQVMLVQVVKEERGSKGAALTTYLSLAGRYSVLMPNTARGGGISRKITNAEDRRRMKEVVEDLQVPEGMGIILRTAGQNRSKPEIKRDFEYLLRVWEQVRDLTLRSTAPTLVYEEGSLTKRSIRDLYNKDIDEIVVAGEQGYKDAKDFMRMLMPSHAKNVKPYRDTQPIFTRYGIESQLDAMFSPTVQLRSGGYIVINQTEALVAIDVNSGRATREHHIEDTALKTNLEAADEVARQLRLRDLAGLIVIDFIDMDEGRNNRTVERRLKEALKHDRARIQVGRISHFGLMEMSRQRIRASVLESSTEKCPYCGGSGHVRSVSSVCLQLLRALEEQLLKGATHNLVVRTRSEVALYILNHKRAHLRALEDRFRIAIVINSDPNFAGQMSYEITRGDQVHTPEAAKAIAAEAAAQAQLMPVIEDEQDLADLAYEDELEEAAEEAAEASSEDDDGAEEGEFVGDDQDGSEQNGEAREGREGRDGGRRRRRRGRRGRGGRSRDREHGPRDDSRMPAGAAEGQNFSGEQGEGAAQGGEFSEFEPGDEREPRMPQGGEGFEANGDGGEDASGENDRGPRRRRRGRRGGRRNRERREATGNGNGNGAPMPREASHGDPSFEPHADAGSYANEDRSPSFSSDAPVSAPAAEAPQQERAPDHASSDNGQDAPTRRRSTVREAPPGSSWSAPAQPSGEASPAPAPTPVVSGGDSETAAQPKRGWWGKRLLGN